MVPLPAAVTCLCQPQRDLCPLCLQGGLGPKKSKAPRKAGTKGKAEKAATDKKAAADSKAQDAALLQFLDRDRVLENLQKVDYLYNR